ncbi:MAG TPA: hypothetical protein PLK94_10880, partial [Alphaproteobacteria bacterium]|nr:hypothetical protein [Alphaproteobacteria bacterium]
LPKQTIKNWNEALSNPQDIQVEVIETGSLVISNHLFLNMKHPNAKSLKKEIIKVPVFCYLIRHSVFGDYLIDAGLDRSFQDNPHGNIRGPLKKILWPLKSDQKKGQDIGSYLKNKDVDLKGDFLHTCIWTILPACSIFQKTSVWSLEKTNQQMVWDLCFIRTIL